MAPEGVEHNGIAAASLVQVDVNEERGKACEGGRSGEASPSAGCGEWAKAERESG